MRRKSCLPGITSRTQMPLLRKEAKRSEHHSGAGSFERRSPKPFLLERIPHVEILKPYWIVNNLGDCFVSEVMHIAPDPCYPDDVCASNKRSLYRKCDQ